MINTLNLTKIYFKQSFNQMFGKTASKKNSKLSGIALVAFIGIILLASCSYMVYSFAVELKAINQEKFILVLGLLYAALINLLLVVYEVQGYFYKTKDYEMLASMPINSISIVTAKYISSYLISLIYSSIVALPAFVIYFMFCGVTAPGVIYAILSLILLPTFTLLIGSLIGFLINIITSKLKNKNMVTTIATLVFVIAFIALFSFGNNGSMGNMFASGEMPLALKIIFPYIYFLLNAIVTGSFVQFLIFLVLTIGYAAIGILVVAGSYKKINSNFMVSSTKVSKKPITFKQNSITKSLIKKESRSFFGSAIWCTNSLVGPIMMIVLAIIFGTIMHSLTLTPEASNATEMFKTIYLCAVSMFAGMSVTTSVTLSLEGHKLSLLKSFPISFSQLAFSKILFNIIMQVPFLLIANIIFLCLIPFNIWFMLLIFIVPLTAVIAFSTLGLIINLKWPKLNWTSETEAVKQSMSLFVSMFGDMLLSMVPMIIYISLYAKISAVLSPNIFFLIMIVWFAIIFLIAFILIKKYGEKLYDEINL